MSNETRLITLSSEELQEVKKVASDDALFKSTALVEMRVMNKKVDLINGTVRAHDSKLNGNKVAHRFYNCIMGAFLTGGLILLRFIFVLYGKIEALAGSIQ